MKVPNLRDFGPDPRRNPRPPGPPGRKKGVGDQRRCAAGLVAVRLGAGGALITLAFAEKLANPALARETLRLFPHLSEIVSAAFTEPRLGVRGCP